MGPPFRGRAGLHFCFLLKANLAYTLTLSGPRRDSRKHDNPHEEKLEVGALFSMVTILRFELFIK